MACTLSPAAFDRQSRAVEQGSAFEAMPKALLEITQVSRGRLVSRMTFSVVAAWLKTLDAASSSLAQVMMIWQSVSTSNSGIAASFRKRLAKRRMEMVEGAQQACQT